MSLFGADPGAHGRGPDRSLLFRANLLNEEMRRPSILLPHLEENEKKFFALVASGKYLQ